MATAIFLIRAGGFYGVSVKRVPHGKKPTGLVLTIQNLLVKSAAAGPSTLIVPELPTGSRNTPDAWLIEICSRLRGGSIDRIVFKGGGTFKIPQWFILLCGQLGIIVEILEPLAFDRRFPSDPIMDNTAFSVCNL